MATQTIPRLTEEEYLAQDRVNEFRSEFVDGEMLAMSGGSARHSVLAADLILTLGSKLADRDCFVFTADMRVRTADSGSYLYPDVSVLCGKPVFHQKKSDVLTNPSLIVEVLSPSTEDYDQSRKWALYREIPSLKDYLMVDSRAHRLILYSRQPDNSWLFREAIGLESSLTVPTLSITLNLAEIYATWMRLPA